MNTSIPPLIALLISTAFLLASPAYAQQSTYPNVESALQAHFSADSNDPAAAVLRKAGYAYERLLVAEMLPSETTVFVEVELAGKDDQTLRYPLKLARKITDGEVGWQVDWAPVEEYARGLVAVGKKDGLAEISAETGWTEIERVPAFPIIVGEQVFVTPYGRVAISTQADDEESQLAPPKKLAEYAQRWVGLTLEDEPGIANVDLILSPKVTWQRATQGLMAPASFGMFRIYVVGQNEGRIVAFPTAAPVVRDTPEGASPLVVGMYPAADQRGFRVRIGDKLVASDKACAEGMSFCAKTLSDFEQRALDQISAAVAQRQAKIAYVMFAATGDFEASAVANHLIALGRSLGVPSSKIFMGYIGGE